MWFPASGWQPVTGYVWFIGSSDATTAHYLHDEAFSLPKDVRRSWPLPDGCDQISVVYIGTAPLAWCLEIVPR